MTAYSLAVHAFQPNYRVNPTVHPVTGVACATPAPVRPAGYAER